MKNIAITTRIIYDKYGSVIDSLDCKWIEFLSYIGFNPVIIPTGVDYEKYIQLLNIDGIVFSGGDDLFSISNNNLSKLRDEKEKKILDFAIKKSIPIYGVCRGMQFIAEYFGSKLTKVSGHVSVNHNIKSSYPFWGSKYLKGLNTVNSFHNYGINILSEKLLSVAIANDFTIEAFTHKKLKIFGQMWHPEREQPYNLFDIELINCFFND